MTADIDRIHEVLNSRESARNSGKTYATCHIIAGHVELEEKNIFITIKTWGEMKHIIRILRYVFDEHDLPFDVQAIPSVIRSSGSTIRFVLNNSQLDDSMRGLKGLIINC